MVTIIALETQDGCRGRPEHTDALVPGRLEPFSQLSRPLQRFFQFIATYNYICQRGVRRVVHPTAEAKLLLVKAYKIMARGVLHCVVILKIRLQDDFAGRLSASCASGYLRQQLKSSFRSPEIRQPESDIGPDNAHESNTVNVVAFGNHLRADHQVEFAFVQRV